MIKYAANRNRAIWMNCHTTKPAAGEIIVIFILLFVYVLKNIPVVSFKRK